MSAIVSVKENAVLAGAFVVGGGLSFLDAEAAFSALDVPGLLEADFNEEKRLLGGWGIVTVGWGFAAGTAGDAPLVVGFSSFAALACAAASAFLRSAA
jgi:hypothetical protein